jgi:CRP-like cAMP-binding protein
MALAAAEREIQVSTTIRLILQRSIKLDEIERQSLLRATTAQQRFPPDRELVRAGTAPPGLYVILSGFACRYVTLQSGQRQILSYLLPGDIFDVRACFAQKTDFFVQSLSEVRATTVPLPALMALTHRFPRLMRELWRLTAIEDAITRQWLLNVGRRTAIQRLAHLLCECFVRLRAAGGATGNTCSIPITQADIADALALTPVHVNRTLTRLRNAGLAELNRHQLTLLNAPALYAVAEFQPDYLHIDAASFHAPPPPAVKSASERYPRPSGRVSIELQSKPQRAPSSGEP